MNKKHEKVMANKVVKVLVLLVIIVLLCLLAWKFVDNKTPKTTSPGHPSSTSKTLTGSLSTSTKNNQTVTQRGSQNNSSPPTTGGAGVTPIITSTTDTDTSVGVFAFVQGVIESNGTCKLTLTNGAQSVSGSVTASAQGTSTNCGNITINKSLLTLGDTYSAVVTYNSPTSSGSSTQSWQITVN